jgi:hypothetical protein
MLIISYGIPKSGSTLTFELINGMLKTIGHAQKRLPDGLVSPGHGVNFLEKVTPAGVDNLVAAVPEGGHICVKTHARIEPPVFLHLEELQKQKKIQIVASFRDPRDICLSLMDAGARAREKGLKAFSECTDLASVLPKVQRNLTTFRIWGAINGTLRLPYEMVAFTPNRAVVELEKVLGFECNRDLAKRHAFEDAFTQKNKGTEKRHETDLTPEENEHLAQVFDKFLRRVMRKNDDEWFSLFRPHFLAKAPKTEPKTEDA